MFNMFNITETLPSYFTRKLVPDYLSSKVALHRNINTWQPFWVASCLEEDGYWCHCIYNRQTDG